jgi:rubredoxin
MDKFYSALVPLDPPACENGRLPTAPSGRPRKPKERHPSRRRGVIPMKAYMCVICGFVYEEAKGHAESGIAPGTKWEDVPLSWRCPDCGAGKEDFEMIEI